VSFCLDVIDGVEAGHVRDENCGSGFSREEGWDYFSRLKPLPQG